MDTVPFRLRSTLERHGVMYETIRHRRDYTAQETAEHTKTPGREFAKAVLMRLDGNFAMAVVPADHRVEVDQIRKLTGAKEVRLGTERELRDLCPDCEPGATPPFGNLYNLPVYLSDWLTGDEWITFNAGTHEQAIRMRLSEYMRIVQPQVLDFSTQH